MPRGLLSCSITLFVEAILDKEIFTLEELLDEEEVIQECKALNSRLIKKEVHVKLLISTLRSKNTRAIRRGSPSTRYLPCLVFKFFN
ncbi:hypothetical protein AHAS_Ahas03G0287500 [Arachis hypogaea]